MSAEDGMPSASGTARKTWRLLPHDPAAVEAYRKALNVSPLVAQLLLNRKIADPADARRFLACPLSDMHEPERLPGMDAAVDRLLAAVRDKRKICVYGDYDVDGVTGTSILLTCLKHLGADVDFHVPHRLTDGYGLQSDTLRQLAQAGVKTVVTVDCGIASIDEADTARELGIELIVTDHHEPKQSLPRADVLVHPRIANGAGAYPFGGLSGAGVAFKVAWALAKRHCGGGKVTPALREFLLDAIALAAMGTVADVVPLFDENRVFVRHGLVRLREHPSLGLKALLRFAKLDAKSSLAAMDIGFGLAPRINAAGRLGTARLAVELLTTPSVQRADVLADYLERQNQERQTIERKIFQEARESAETMSDAPALVVAGEGWHPGLLGIVASRLVDRFGRPALMISLRPGELGQGSGRSIPGFPLHLALDACTDLLVSHGGHAAAAGFRIRPEQVDAFRERFAQFARSQFGARAPAATLTLDAEVQLVSLTSNVLLTIEQMEPFGAGNPPPLLLADRVKIVGQPQKVGGGERHLAFRVRQGAKELRAIAFGMADRVDDLMSQDGACCLAFVPRLNEWNGFKSVEIEVKDFQPGPTPTLAG